MPCKLSASFLKNQCACRMTESLKAAHRSILSGFGGRTCGCGKRHAFAAEELAKHLKKKKVWYVGKPVRFKPGSLALSKIRNKTGIVFFKDFWRRKIGKNKWERFPSGDHIDVWKTGKQGNGSTTYFSRSTEVWFWEIK